MKKFVMVSIMLASGMCLGSDHTQTLKGLTKQQLLNEVAETTLNHAAFLRSAHTGSHSRRRSQEKRARSTSSAGAGESTLTRSKSPDQNKKDSAVVAARRASQESRTGAGSGDGSKSPDRAKSPEKKQHHAELDRSKPDFKQVHAEVCKAVASKQDKWLDHMRQLKAAQAARAPKEVTVKS